jgi:hypothetical protein
MTDVRGPEVRFQKTFLIINWQLPIKNGGLDQNINNKKKMEQPWGLP